TGKTVKMRLRRAVTRLPVATEQRRGYDRDKFRHWVDANGDCQDTRDEVLAAESRTEVSGCDITTGRWRSYYDGQEWTSSSDVDIDHLVPLAEAWDSGAHRWTTDTRERFANDLHDLRSLAAVTDNANQSKSDQDPAEWMPQLGKCRYVREWVAVKIRWRLNVNRPEKRALHRRAGNCQDTVVKVHRATVRTKSTGGGGGGSANCAPGYSPCVPPPPPDLDCSDLDGPIKVTGSDPHNLDGDGDGWGCES
ncbi:MAG: HNH endonuclease family protein, partial [Nocardioides sp.]